MRRTWTPPASAGPYLYEIYKAEDDNGMPRNLLARQLYQESHYRPDIISGETKSGAGAVGIAQIVPRWHPGVDPLDPYESIRYAGRYMATLYRRYGSWKLALAAYNWGMGNLDKYGIERAPAETRAYIGEILGDVRAA